MPVALAERSCSPCRGGIPPLTEQEAAAYHAQAPDWALLDEAKRIERAYRFKNFAEAFRFVERAAALAEAEGHHPDICFGWGYAKVSLHQEGQRTARERLHHGGKARSHCRREHILKTQRITGGDPCRLTSCSPIGPTRAPRR